MTEDEIENQLKKNTSTINFLLDQSQKRWSKTQQKFHSIYILVNAHTETDKRTHEAMKSLRRAIASLQQQEHLKFELIKKSEAEVKEKSKGLENRARKQAAKLNRTNSITYIGIALLFFFYIKNDIEAGKVVDAILTIIGASGLTVYGLHRNNDEDPNID